MKKRLVLVLWVLHVISIILSTAFCCFALKKILQMAEMNNKEAIDAYTGLLVFGLAYLLANVMDIVKHKRKVANGEYA